MALTYDRPAPPGPASLPSGPAYAHATAAEKPGLPWTALIGDAGLKTVVGRALDNKRDLRAALATVEEMGRAACGDRVCLSACIAVVTASDRQQDHQQRTNISTAKGMIE